MIESDNIALPAEVQAIALQGWNLFPIEPRSKSQPLIKEWPEKATSDLEQLSRWAREFRNCNWGVVTGQAFFVLDVDSRRAGENWLESKYTQYGCEWANTRQVASGGGVHFYFSMPAFTVQNSAGTIHSGIDIRGWHGFAVTPPSTHPDGKQYTWRGDPNQKILAAPGWLLELLQKKQTSPRSTSASTRTIPEGRRNAELASLAGSMRRRGAGETAITAALLTENTERCDPPLPETEVEKIAASIGRYEAEPPEPQLIFKPRPVKANTVPEDQFETLSQLASLTPTATISGEKGSATPESMSVTPAA